MFIKLLTATFLVYCLAQNGAFAQVTLDNSKLPNPYSELKTLAGYQPSILASEESALSAYQLLQTGVFSKNSQCYQRADTWSHLLEDHFALKSMKVFLFFTHRYQREFDYTWTYHTAPLIPTLMKDGTVQDLVFDPTFTSTPKGGKAEQYDDKPISVEAWTRYFIFPEVECKTIEDYQEFIDNQETYYCYLMKTPMYGNASNERDPANPAKHSN